MNFAKKLFQFDFDAKAFARRAPKPIAIPAKQIAVLKKIIKDHDGRGSGPPNVESLRQIYYLFIDTPPNRLSSVFNTLRRIRQLAWALTYNESGLPRIVDTQQLHYALQIIGNRFRISAFLGVFYALLQAWDSQNVTMLRTFVKEYLTDYDGSRNFVQKLKANMTWYCEENGPTQLAMYISRLQKKLSEVWSAPELPEYTHNYPYFGTVAEAYVSISKFRNVEIVADVIDFVKKHNNDETSRVILSKVIEQLGNDASESLRQSVQSYVLQKWKDPRIAGGNVRWRGVSDEARKIFTRWITKEDLRFFFDVVARACGDSKFEYRKEFWLAYLEHISFCRPVLRRDAEYLFRYDKQALEYYRDRQPATLKGGTKDQHAFIIQMGDYTFVEFSTAAACHIYYLYNVSSLDPFELDASEYNMNELRNRDEATHRVMHTHSAKYSWQSKFALWLENRLDIEPLRSYRLDGRPNSYNTSAWWNY